MTKQQEIDLLDQTIAAFGPNSYLGPWLTENREQIVADVHNDLEPRVLLPSDAIKQAKAILDDATNTSARLMDNVSRQCIELEAKTRNDIAAARHYAHNAMERAAANL